MKIRTRLTELAGIDYPIIQAPMNWMCGPRLVAAVSNAGGLGTMSPNAGREAPITDPVECAIQLGSQVTKIRELTKKPFAVNFSAYGAQQYYWKEWLKVLLELKPPVVISIMGRPADWVKDLHKAGIKVFHAVTTLEHAETAEKAGVDAVVVEGYEGGGHIGDEDMTLMSLVPQVVNAVRIPVIAGGSIAHGRQLAAALSLGAEGVYMGTRFIATHECDAPLVYKEAIVKAKSSDTIVLGKTWGRGRERVLKNKCTLEVERMETSGASAEECLKHHETYPLELPKGVSAGRRYAALKLGDMVEGTPLCGQSVGLVKEIKSAKDVINDMMNQAEEAIGRLNGLKA